MPISSRPKHDTLSPGGTRHISFNEKYENDEKRSILRHAHFMHASSDIVLSRYLSWFERRLPAFIDHRIQRVDIQTSSQIRIHHKDDVELHRLRRVQFELEGVDYDPSMIQNEDLLLIIDAFQTYIETFLKHNGKTSFILRCTTEQHKDHSETSMEVHLHEVFNRIILSLNRICHSPLNHFKPGQVAEMLAILFSNLSDSNCKSYLPFLIVNYHRLDQKSDEVMIEQPKIPLFERLELPANTLDRFQLLALDILMRSIEQSSERCPYRHGTREEKIMDESTKRFLTRLFHQIHNSNRADRSLLSNTTDCARAFRAILKKIFTYSASAMVLTMKDHRTYVDYQIDRRYFELVMTFFEHLHRMHRRCTNEDEQYQMMDYFSTVLFGVACREKLSTRMKQIFLLLIEHINDIQ